MGGDIVRCIVCDTAFDGGTGEKTAYRRTGVSQLSLLSPGSVKKQTVTIGTELLELNLPDTVTATIYHVIEDTVIPDKDNTEDESDDSSIASPSDADDSVSGNHAGDSSETDSGEIVTTVTTTTEEIPVIWDSEPAYEGGYGGRLCVHGASGRLYPVTGCKAAANHRDGFQRIPWKIRQRSQPRNRSPAQRPRAALWRTGMRAIASRLPW